MNQNDEEYLARLRKHAAKTRTLFSNEQKSERERMAVRAFLRCIGEQFSDDEVRVTGEEPIDVSFRSARFQLMDIVGDKKRGLEWIERERRYHNATQVSDLLEPWRDSRPIPFSEISQQIAADLAKKAARYGAAICAQLDALIYVDLGDALIVYSASPCVVASKRHYSILRYNLTSQCQPFCAGKLSRQPK